MDDVEREEKMRMLSYDIDEGKEALLYALSDLEKAIRSVRFFAYNGWVEAITVVVKEINHMLSFLSDAGNFYIQQALEFAKMVEEEKRRGGDE